MTSPTDLGPNVVLRVSDYERAKAALEILSGAAGKGTKTELEAIAIAKAILLRRSLVQV